MTVPEKILEFSHKQADWIQDALRRLATQPELSEQDKAELARMAKAACGVASDDATPVAQPLSEAHFAPAGTAAGRVVLLEIWDVKRVNRLAEGQHLRFAPQGITLVYGDNGSGKSGYCRLVKRLCRIREGAEEAVHPNIYKPQPVQPAEALVRFSCGSSQETVTWQDGAQTPTALRRISVFDSKAAPLYAGKEGKVEYLPYGLDLLPRLGRTLTELGRDLAVERSAVEQRCRAPLPALPAGTTAAALATRLTTLARIEQLPPSDEIAVLAQFDETHKARLSELDRALSENSAALATLVEKGVEAARMLAAELTAIVSALDDTALAAIRAEMQAARKARRTADEAAKTAFEVEPLDGLGSEPWRQMFQYAREFSAVAYPSEEFPVTGPGRRCVLCLQEVDAEASDRLRRFDSFVRGAAEQEAQRLAGVMAKKMHAVEALAFDKSAGRVSALAGFDDADDSLKAEVEAFIEALRTRKNLAIEFLLGGRDDLIAPALRSNPSPRLTGAATRLAARAAELRAVQAEPEVRRRLEAERTELNARKTLAENAAVIQARRSDLELLQRLKNAQSTCDTSALSKKNTDLRREFITDAFRARLRDELSLFDLGYLPIAVEDRTDHGVSFIGVALTAERQVPISDILSEGERKAVALAAFFAEVGGLIDGSGLVFDDPVSSLDHVRRRQVAERLVFAAAQGRQVVVFTHDLTLFNEIQLAAAGASPQVPVVTHEVRRIGESGFGTVRENTEPWFVTKVRPRLPVLEKRLSELRVEEEKGPDEHRKAAVAFYTDLRETWERLVEAELLNGVVSRLCKDIMTLRLKGVTVESEDYRRIFFAVKRASEWSGHSSPPAGQAALPSPQVAAEDLQELKDFLQVVKGRRKILESEREALEAPPKAALS